MKEWKLKTKQQWINLIVLQFSQLNNGWNKWTALALFFPCFFLSWESNLNCKMPKPTGDSYLLYLLIYWEDTAPINMVAWKRDAWNKHCYGKMYLVPPSVVSSPTGITKSMREMKPILFTGVHFCAIICSKDGHQNPIYNQNWKESSAVLALLKGNANLRNKFSLAQLPGDFGIKTYWNTKSTHCLGSSTA